MRAPAKMAAGSLDDKPAGRRGIASAVKHNLRPQPAVANGVLVIVTGPLLNVIGLDAVRHPAAALGRSPDEDAGCGRFRNSPA